MTRNTTLLKALNIIVVFGMVPGPVMHSVTEMLQDTNSIDLFLDRSKAELAQNYHLVTKELERANVNFVPAVAGLFIWIDMRPALPQNATFADEFRLFELMCEC